MTYPLVRVVRPDPHLDTATFARATGLHPELVRRLAVLGLVEHVTGPDGELWFPAGEVAAVARLHRLRAGFSLNYAALGLVVELLDHIAELESALRRHPRRTGG